MPLWFWVLRRDLLLSLLDVVHHEDEDDDDGIEFQDSFPMLVQGGLRRHNLPSERRG